MFGSSYKIATVWGIPIRVHISLVLLLAFVALRVGEAGGLPAVAQVMIIELGIITSIALHELGHSFVAIRKGSRVREITLMFIGGAAQIERIPERPRDELVMAVAGPAVSIALGTGLWFGGGLLPLPRYLWPLFGLNVVGNIVQIVGVINLALAAFNLLPSFPMDGGRVLRAVLAARMGRLRATYIAARLGRVMAILFGAYGLLATPTRWILLMIAVFIYAAAGREYTMVRMREAARRAGGGFHPGWPFAPPGNDNPFDDRGAGEDDVVIGPPPYADDDSQHTGLRR